MAMLVRTRQFRLLRRSFIAGHEHSLIKTKKKKKKIQQENEVFKHNRI